MDKEKQKQEAIERMKMLNIYEPTIREFEKDNIVNKSEQGGILFWLNDKEQEMVKDFENKYNALVYHIIHNYTAFGELYSIFYVSENEEDWDYDKDDIKENCACVYVKNIDDEFCSEFGSIGIKEQFGGLVRVC
jgi:hypothetical protein